jgi:hypothetical protein
MIRTMTWMAILLAASVSWAEADDAEKVAMGRVRLTTEASLTVGCTRIGSASDDSVRDLRRKIVRVGGDTALLSFRTDDMSMIHADIFRCPSARTAPPIPPPPPGPPPPPPPPTGPPR